MRSICWRTALLAGAAILAAGPALASRPADGEALRAYVRARAADADGDLDAAARGYANVLADAPGDNDLAARAYRQALNAGDFALAGRAAAMLAGSATAGADVRLFTFAGQVTAGNWMGARASTDLIERDRVFAFVAPLLRAWTAFGAHEGDPLLWLRGLPANGIAAAYGPEHRAYLLLAAGRFDEGVAAVQALSGLPPARETRVRLAAAALLAGKGRRAQAEALLTGDTAPIAAARASLAAGRSLPAPVDTPAAGIAELFVRLAADVDGQHAQPLALSLARLATRLAPGNAETWLLTGELLAEGGQTGAAIALLDRVPPGDPFADTARAARIRLLAQQGDKAGALAAAQAAAARPGAAADDWTRVGDVLSDLGRDREAADAYGRAAALSAGDKGDLWQALLLQGGALERAGAWPEARSVLTRAAQQAPDQAVVLNYLGYAQLSRRENLPEAASLIERASRLKPDDAAIADSLGWAWFVQGDVPKAIAKLEGAARASPADPTVNEHLGDAYWSAGRRYEARYAWRAALVEAESADAARLRRKIEAGWSAAVAAP